MKSLVKASVNFLIQADSVVPHFISKEIADEP